jgi:hypothetical protein
MPAPAPSPFAYALLRVVPDIERGESLNAGVILFARQLGFLAARVSLNEERLRVLAPSLSPSDVLPHLDAVVRVAAGDPQAGPIAALSQSERFGWLVAPASAIIQPSPVHTGFCVDPTATLDDLFARLIG